MNERIKELFMQSLGVNYIPAPIEDHIPLWTEKFAELIVRECCLVLEQTQTALDRHKWPTPSECGIYIKQHFGVEE